MTMKTMRVSLLLGVALLVIAAQAPAQMSPTPPETPAQVFPPDEAAGYITVYDQEQQYCFVPVLKAGSGATRVYDFRAGGAGCYNLNDKAWSIAFEDLPSATEILLTDNSTCTTSGTDVAVGKFWIKLKTTRKVTITEIMQLPYFFRFTQNTIIKPGLLLVDSYLKGSSTDALNALSCIRITTSRATLPKPTVPISQIDQNVQWVDWDQGFTFHCGGNRVLLGRAHFGDEEDPNEFRCGTPMQGETAITLRNHKTAATHEFRHYFVCPVNTVMTGHEHDGDERGETRYTCAEAWAGDTPLYVLPDDFRTPSLEENHHRFACGGDKVLIGRAHWHDELGETWYQCGTVYQQSPP
ncbi:hypothetical protein [Pseudomonas putida]|uniref:Uncharacterized protein n=1 Tax=Pseudomonas putida TaxID=303 RepID=A0A177STR3_PSEPU|nr:hypothetical protein [Pseudomonas putida]OAI94189.1 hypothetical protein AYO28_10005 [Pseudomonas putida]